MKVIDVDTIESQNSNLKKDYFLSDALVRYLCYEMNMEINLKLEKEDSEEEEELF